MFDATRWVELIARDELPPHPPAETPRAFRARKRGEHRARWLRQYAAWLRPIILEWIVEPVAQLVNAIIDERLGDNQRAK